jgi:UDP-glucose:(indol-3-yl)acetate beta-D-glucosyltransferase
VERCIDAVTKGTDAADMRRRAAELKQATRSAMAPGGSLARNLDLFINDIKIVKNDVILTPK